jgi:hypothetical protein
VRRQRGHRAIPVTVLLIALGSAIALGSTASGTSDPPIPFLNGALAPFGDFAGYTWQGDPTSISAQWRVPAILPGSPEGDAATWIGVQGNEAPFVQIGTLEDEYTLSGKHVAEYVAFWSDTQEHFEPQIFAVVRPGDPIVASMDASTTGWKLTFDDQRNPTPVVLDNTEPPTGYSQGEWLQEDPGGGAPYPKLASVSFSDVQINHESPALSFDDASWLTTPDGRIYGPQPVTRNPLTVTAVTPDNAQRQLLVDVAATNRLGSKLFAEQAAWALPPSRRKAVAAAAPYRADEVHVLHELATQTWPGTALSQVEGFERVEAKFISCVKQLYDAEPTPPLALVARCQSLASHESTADLALRRSLGLPPAAPLPPVTSKTASTPPAERLLASALTDLKAAHSVHVDVSLAASAAYVPPKSTTALVGLNADLFANGDLQGSAVFGTTSRKLMILGHATYQRLSATSLERLFQLPTSVAETAAGNWLTAAPAAPVGKYASLTYPVDDTYSLHSLEGILAEDLGPLTDVGVVNFAGKRAILLRSTSGSSLWVAAGSVHFPIQASTLTDDGVMTISFGNWNHASLPRTPSQEFSITLLSLLRD